MKQAIGEFIMQPIRYFFNELHLVEDIEDIDLDDLFISFIGTYYETIEKLCSSIEQHDCDEEAVKESY